MKFAVNILTIALVTGRVVLIDWEEVCSGEGMAVSAGWAATMGNAPTR